ncbi:tetratricopeptide repeat protein [Kibdelosporangium lantanae]|uniref:Tetratricopeptide repeat protein n=1 Tax=Kibdelosporangium lantanae TaxID=1497396 RepID=A0ABW3M3E7_9PSEU
MTEVFSLVVPDVPVVDVVFLHGLGGDARTTWQAGEAFWPLWLGQDVAGVAVWSVGYAASPSGWLGRAMPLQDRAVNVLAALRSRGVGERPLVLVTHSMGGLAAKQMLRHADSSPTYASFAAAARGVVFLATPHSGASLATFLTGLKVVLRTTAAGKDLQRNAALLRDLNVWYRNWASKTGIGNLVFFEAYPTLGVRIVDAASADPAIVGADPIAVDADHFTICKPDRRSTLVYGQVHQFLTSIRHAATATEPATTPLPVTTPAQTTSTVRHVDRPVDRGAYDMPATGVASMGSEVFVGRGEELRRLDAALSGSSRVVMAAVHGLGGVGKTALAAHYTRTRADRYTLVWWITADTSASIDAGLADLATALGLVITDAAQDTRTRTAITWLTTQGGWLLVLDNLTSPANAHPLLSRLNQHSSSAPDRGTVLVTTRRSTGWRGFTTLPIDVLPPRDAEDLLTRTIYTDWPDADLTGTTELCAALGELPLAIEQAGAYIAQTRLTPAAYLDRLTHQPAHTLTAHGEDHPTHRTIGQVWRLTLDHLATTPHTGRLLRQLAWYAPDDIPRWLLNDTPDHPEVADALGRLAAYSMITLTTATVSVHRLVQTVARTPDPDDPHRRPHDITTALHTATTALSGSLSGLDASFPSSWPRYRAVLPHTQALVDHSSPDTDTDTTCQLLNDVGCFLRDQGTLAAATMLLARALDSTQRLHSPDHPDTLASRNNLAGAYQLAGDLHRAIPLYETTLDDRTRVLGPDDPHILVSRNNLAYAYWSAGDLDRAIPLYETTLTDNERVFGTDHFMTLTSRNNLAIAYQSAGDLDRAIPLYETTLDDRMRVLGSDHPMTFASRNNLAGAYQLAGDVDRAISLYQAIFADSQRVLGTDHPMTFTSRNNLASAYQSAGDRDRAIPLYEATLTHSERVLGPEHPTTQTIRNNLNNASNK